EGFNLTEREFALVKQELVPGSRQFLIKQNRDSVVAQLDLRHLDDALGVISGRTSNVRLMQALMKRHGDAPTQWLAPFREAL
ncbi:hypothetical protein Q0N24_14600, partial [Staphylococcus aureus]|nr:hypothetical protein [Staphylococcus aureus]